MKKFLFIFCALAILFSSSCSGESAKTPKAKVSGASQPEGAPEVHASGTAAHGHVSGTDTDKHVSDEHVSGNAK